MGEYRGVFIEGERVIYVVSEGRVGFLLAALGTDTLDKVLLSYIFDAVDEDDLQEFVLPIEFILGGEEYGDT